MKNNRRFIETIKYCCYALFLTGLYVIQTTPHFLEISGVKPGLIVPAVICIAMYEGEFAGGLLGAYGGMLCDLGSYTIFGFHAILLLILATATGLGIIYFIKNNRLNAIFLCGGALALLNFLNYFFYFGIWDYENAWMLLVTSYLPAVLCSILFVPLFYWLFGWSNQYFESKVKE